MERNIPWDYILAFLKGELPEQEKAELEAWCDDPRNKDIYNEIESLWKEVRSSASLYEPDIESNWLHLKKRMYKNRPGTFSSTRRLSGLIAASVAVLLILLGITGLFYIGKSPADQGRQVFAVVSGRSHVWLPDSSSVWLNTGSSISYPTSFKEDRTIELSGEALFEVKKGERIFSVSGEETMVRVYGTRFLMRSYPRQSYVQLTLIDGKVSFSGNNKEIILQPGQSALYDKNTKEIELIEADPQLESSWANDFCKFDSQPLSVICQYLERWYNIQIELDPSIAATKYSFTITDEPLETILQNIARLDPVLYEFKENKQVIISK